MNGGPLGKYATIGAFIASLGVVLVWVLLSAAESLEIGSGPTDQMTTFAILGFGILIGQVGMNQQAQIIASEKLNGQREAVAALHRRLDAANISPAPPVIADH